MSASAESSLIRSSGSQHPPQCSPTVAHVSLRYPATAPTATKIHWLWLAAFAALFVSSPTPAWANFCTVMNSGRYDVIYVCPTVWQFNTKFFYAQPRSAATGYSYVIAPLDSITPCYGPGRAGIRELIRHALTSWNPPPRCVVLVGAFSYYDSVGDVVPTYRINDPTLSLPGHMDIHWLPTDDPYVFADDSLALPAIPIARLPIMNSNDLLTYRDKVAAYVLDPQATWKHRALHIVEDRDLDYNSGSLARLHADSLRSCALRFAANYDHSILRATEAPPVKNAPFVHAMNEGQGLVVASGTAGNELHLGYVLKNPSCMTLYAGTASDSLLDNNKAAIILATSCGAGLHFGIPTLGFNAQCGTLAQNLLYGRGKGAVCFLGPTRALRETAAFAFARAWLQSAFGDDNPNATAEVGPVTLQAKRFMLRTFPAYRNEILSMMILGDPTIEFPVWFYPTIGVIPPPYEGVTLSMTTLPSTTGSLQITLSGLRPGPYRLQLFDVAGRRIDAQTLVAEVNVGITRITFSMQRPGIYFAMATGNGQVATTKCLVLR